MKPLISVIVPIYNVEKYIDICLRSIVCQTYENLEIILIDDGSNDGCEKKCEDWKNKDFRIKAIHKKNAGLGFARNTGIQNSHGKYVVFIDSDDYVEENMIEKLYSSLVENHADTVYCGVKRLFQNGRTEIQNAIYSQQEVFEGSQIVDKILLRMLGNVPEKDDGTYFFASVWHGIYSMDIIREYNIEFPSERIFMSEDISFHVDYLNHCKKVVCIPDACYYYRINRNSLSLRYDANRFERIKQMHVMLYEKLLSYIDEERFRVIENGYFLSLCRGELAKAVKRDGWKSLNVVRKITNDSQVREIISRFPYHKNLLGRRLFNFFIAKRWNAAIVIVIKMKNGFRC